MNAKRPVVNPYAKVLKNHVAATTIFPLTMGRQSQQRISNTKRAFKLCNPVSKKKPKKGDQLTLEGAVAFVPEKDCQVYKPRAFIKQSGYTKLRVPNRAHHPLCPKNSATKGKGILNEQTIACQVEENDLRRLCNTQLQPSEKASSKHITREAFTTFFTPILRQKPQDIIPIRQQLAFSMTEVPVTPLILCQTVTSKLSSPVFREKHKSKSAPLAMVAFAEVVQEKIINDKAATSGAYFDNLTMTVPRHHTDNNPKYHSIIGPNSCLLIEKKPLELSCHAPMLIAWVDLRTSVLISLRTKPCSQSSHWMVYPLGALYSRWHA